MTNLYDYIILGGGVTGLAAARLLQQRGENNILLLEGESEIGGLCRTKEVDGHYLDIGGGHVLHSIYPKVLDWIFDHIPREDFNVFNTKILINLEGHDIEFPVELNLWQLPPDLQVEYVMSYLNAASRKIEYDNFEDWIRNYLGDKIADNYMIPYNNKLWCIDISKLNTDWLVKIPQTDIELIVRTIVERKSKFDESVVSHASFYYPSYGGFQSIINAIYEPIKSLVRTDSKVVELKHENDWLVTTESGEQYRTKNVINTVPWPLLNIKLDGFDFEENFKKLEVLSNVISLWEREYHHDAHWKYIPDPDVDHHREFYIHNFAPYSKKHGVMTDINHKRWLQNNKQWKDGKPLYEHENIWSYPLPTKIYKEAITELLNFTKQYNLYGLGRWGTWKYFNTDQCIKQCMDFLSDPDNFNYEDIF